MNFITRSRITECKKSTNIVKPSVFIFFFTIFAEQYKNNHSRKFQTMSFFSKFMPAINWIKSHKNWFAAAVLLVWIRSHKYLFVTTIFLVIVLFIDDKSMIKHIENRYRISTLEKEIARMKQDSIEVERKNSEIGPNGDIHEIERICREKHDMHAANEDIFIIEKR